MRIPNGNLWYIGCKLFALGRYITDDLLAPLTVPS